MINRKTLLLYKPVGITPLQLIKQFQELYPEYQQVKLGYAGRLDPMAKGLLLVLVGEENKKRNIYEAVQKEYACTILFGIETDTYDILGKVTNQTIITDKDNTLLLIKAVLPSLVGKHVQPYPPYSSQPVYGKPLYYWARENRLSEIAIPTKEIEIYTMKLVSHREIFANYLQSEIYARVAKVIGNFRQKEILHIWDNFFQKNTQDSFLSIRLHISCSSGTYVRSLAHRLGKEMGSGAITIEIERTKVGKYNVEDALNITYN